MCLPCFSITYNLGKRRMFNQQLNDMEHRYTYFVPRDHAWLKFQIKHPSAFKSLFREDFGYYVSFYFYYSLKCILYSVFTHSSNVWYFQTKQILERHVIRAGRAYTVSDLKLLANETHPFVLPTSRDPLRLRVKESDKSKLLAVHLHYYLYSLFVYYVVI